jgi:cation-transporting P-type ATPase D
MKINKLQHLKRNNYDNCLMLSPSGKPMFRCLKKKIYWYVDRGLAKIINEVEPLTAQLLFSPKGTGHFGDDFFLYPRANKCVVCGSVEKLTRHHIIPHCYVKFIPIEYRRNNSYDVMIMCAQHHGEYEEYAKLFKAELAEKYDAPLHGIGGGAIPKRFKARAFVNTLLEHKHQIPPERIQEMLDLIADALDYDKLTLEDLKTLPEFTYSTKPKIHHGAIVLSKVDDLDNFVIMWRNHFLKTMQPKCLPKYWDSKRRIYEEKDQNKNKFGLSS